MDPQAKLCAASVYPRTFTVQGSQVRDERITTHVFATNMTISSTVWQTLIVILCFKNCGALVPEAHASGTPAAM